MTKKALVFTLALTALLVPSPGSGQSSNSETISGWLQASSSCPQGPFELAVCPCPIPQVTHYVFSTKVDLSQYIGHFVTLRGSTQTGNCQASLFQARKATVEPNRPCPCMASSEEASPAAARSAAKMICAK